MIKQKLIYVFIFTNILTSVYAQSEVNQFDKDSLRHGLWTKNYHKTDQKRYEGIFEHGKEVGEFKYYTLKGGKSVLSATKFFNKQDDIALVKFYTSSGKVISEGKMDGKNYIGKWTYYHKNSPIVMMSEYYNDQGLLDGERKVFYPNGIIAEQAQYNNGQLNGVSTWFSKQGKIIKSYNYTNDKLNGEAVYYDTSQQISSKGQYKNNMKVGVWNYYDNGILKKRVDHTKQEVIPIEN
ncbi:MAG: toxin-antitoxin system YwqK family antitoxin [Winogradskyella sp.]|nr:toxin-antitoxin system YwqK family antitoxin [Winogradskyella sp.]NNL83952.1 toxin-antitoxin system YwqK family antitoxin [Winogradskyella sp.]